MVKSVSRYRRKVDPSREEYEIDEWPFYHLARLIARYYLKMDASLKPIGIDVPRWRVMTILAKYEVATVSQIAVESVIKMSTMAKIVQRMSAQGLVTTRTSAEDARSTEVLLTDEGRALFDAARSKASFIAKQAFDDVSDEELRFVNAVSRKISANLAP